MTGQRGERHIGVLHDMAELKRANHARFEMLCTP